MQHAVDDSEGWQQKLGVWQEAQVADVKPQSSYTQHSTQNYCTTGIPNTYVIWTTARGKHGAEHSSYNVITLNMHT